jgi:CRP-like cAMP-binding protein
VPTIQETPANRLLATLPNKERRHLLGNCDTVELVFAETLSRPGEPIRYVYFPTDSVISLAIPIDGDVGLEVELIGNEGMLGIPLMLGVDISPFNALVQIPGPALRITAPWFLLQLEQSPALQDRLKHYLYVLIRQLAQTAACNRFHVVEKRLARLLLMTRDRAHSDQFRITHELLADMLGVRRVGVTKAAGTLQQKQLISYHRGNLRIHDIAGLEAVSCGCYQADKETYDRVMRS